MNMKIFSAKKMIWLYNFGIGILPQAIDSMPAEIIGKLTRSHNSPILSPCRERSYMRNYYGVNDKDYFRVYSI